MSIVAYVVSTAVLLPVLVVVYVVVIILIILIRIIIIIIIMTIQNCTTPWFDQIRTDDTFQSLPVVILFCPFLYSHQSFVSQIVGCCIPWYVILYRRRRRRNNCVCVSSDGNVSREEYNIIHIYKSQKVRDRQICKVVVPVLDSNNPKKQSHERISCKTTTR